MMGHYASEMRDPEPIVQAGPQEKVIWLVVKRWPGGRQEFDAAYLDEASARQGASKIFCNQWMVSLETVRLGDQT